MQLLIAKTHNMEYNMKIIIRIIGTLLAIVKLLTASELTSKDPYISNNSVIWLSLFLYDSFSINSSSGIYKFLNLFLLINFDD